MAQLMPLPLTVSCFCKIQIAFTFLVPAHLGSPGKRPLNGCVYVCVSFLQAGYSSYHPTKCFDGVGWAAGRASGPKTEWSGSGMVICLERGADLHVAQLMPLPLTISCFSKIQIGFTLMVLAHPCCPGQRAINRVCV